MAKANPLKKAREALKLSQQELANRAGLSVATIYRAERRGEFPRWKHIAAAYRQALGLAP